METANTAHNEQPPGKKIKTSAGRPVANYTMLVEFKPQYQRANPTTGEVKQRWTYRHDLELKKFAAQKPLTFVNEIDVLGFIYARDNHKYSMCRIYDNTRAVGQQILYEEVNGTAIFPTEPQRLLQFKKWINSFLNK